MAPKVGGTAPAMVAVWLTTMLNRDAGAEPVAGTGEVQVERWFVIFVGSVFFGRIYFGAFTGVDISASVWGWRVGVMVDSWRGHCDCCVSLECFYEGLGVSSSS